VVRGVISGSVGLRAVVIYLKPKRGMEDKANFTSEIIVLSSYLFNRIIIFMPIFGIFINFEYLRFQVLFQPIILGELL
jgi:hypothetical protein